jgi:hypothetical protein
LYLQSQKPCFSHLWEMLFKLAVHVRNKYPQYRRSSNDAPRGEITAVGTRAGSGCGPRLQPRRGEDISYWRNSASSPPNYHSYHMLARPTQQRSSHCDSTWQGPRKSTVPLICFRTNVLQSPAALGFLGRRSAIFFSICYELELRVTKWI